MASFFYGRSSRIPHSHPLGGAVGLLTLIPLGEGGLTLYGAYGGQVLSRSCFFQKLLGPAHLSIIAPFLLSTSWHLLAIEPTSFPGATYALTAFEHLPLKSSELSLSSSFCLRLFSAFGQTFSCGLNSGLLPWCP